MSDSASNYNLKHFGKTWTAKNGAKITEGGYVTGTEAWGPGLLILCYVLAALAISSCVVFTALFVIYKGDIKEAFRDDRVDDDFVNQDEENNNW